MSHPRVEEVSDSDPDAASSDPEEGDIDDFADADIMRRIPAGGGGGGARFSTAPAAAAAAAAAPPGRSRMLDPDGAGAGPTRVSDADHGAYKGFQSLYPVYFDATRSRAEGRRVSARLAVRNPLAREIANACSRLRLQTLLEPDKVHPKDWANPGRVKVGLKARVAAAAAPAIANKHHLYLLVAQHLAANPTTDDSPGLRVRMGGQLQPPEGQPYPRPAVPRGWKMGELLPYLSAAMTGGGVSENLFKDMMREMQSGGDPMAALMAGQQQPQQPGAADEGASAKKKKDKKGRARA